MNDFVDVSEHERMNVLLRDFQTRINTSIPCVVSKVHKNYVDIELNILRKFSDAIQDSLIVYDVPVIYPGAGNYSITFPIKPGDTGLALFSQRSIDAWLDGKTTIPNNIRLHDMSDALFLPGLRPLSYTSIPTDGMKIESGDLVISLKSNGKISINNGSFELVSLVKELVQILTRTTTVPFIQHSPSTPTPELLITAAEFAALMTKLETF